MKKELKPGLAAEVSFVVEKKHLANEVGSGMVSVFSTAMLIAGMEAAAVKAVQDCLEDGFTTVGVHVDVWHRAATPCRMKVRFSAVLREISANGKGFKFDLQAFDEVGLIGEGKHERVLVQKEKFESRTSQRGA